MVPAPCHYCDIKYGSFKYRAQTLIISRHTHKIRCFKQFICLYSWLAMGYRVELLGIPDFLSVPLLRYWPYKRIVLEEQTLDHTISTYRTSVRYRIATVTQYSTVRYRTGTILYGSIRETATRANCKISPYHRGKKVAPDLSGRRRSAAFK
jgi:hypothetical protein